MAHAAARIGHVTGAPRNHVLMQMRDGLACCGADIHAEVEAVDATALADDRADRVDGGKQLGALGIGGVEPGRHMPVRHDQRMAVGDRETIPKRKDVVQSQEHPLRVWVAEGTPARVVVGCAWGHGQRRGVVSGYSQIGCAMNWVQLGELLVGVASRPHSSHPKILKRIHELPQATP